MIRVQSNYHVEHHKIKMYFNEIDPNQESFDFRMFESLPMGRWRSGINRMLFGKYQVGISLKGSGIYAISYWGGEKETALYLCGVICGICLWLPEKISETDLRAIFPYQRNKDLSDGFFNDLFKASELARSCFQTGNN